MNTKSARFPRFAVGLPKSPDAPLTTFARRAEELGFAGLWTVDHAVGEVNAQDPTLDSLHTLTFVSAVTRCIRLGVAVIVLPRRHPAQLARDLATIDRLSNGRLTVGVGLGGDDPTAAALGFPHDRKVSRLVEGVSVMRALWQPHGGTFQGELYRFSGVPLQPETIQKPNPPIWFGARAPVALRRAARMADGWIGAGSSSSQDFSDQVTELRSALTVERRDTSSFTIAKRVYIAVESDEQLARHRLVPVLDFIYRSAGMTDRCAVFGTPSQCAEKLQNLVNAGANELILTPLYDELAQLEALAEVVDVIRYRAQ